MKRNPDDDTDDHIDGDGSGDPLDRLDDTDPSMDEDDHDAVEVEICDLALVNKLVTVPMTPTVGDTVKYDVMIYNQGNAEANRVNIAYLIPNGLGYLPVNDIHNPMWSYNNTGVTNIETNKLLAPGEIDTVCLYLEIMDLPTSEVTEESWRTIAEITSFADASGDQKTTDADSTPDDDFTNDPGGNPFDDTDNEVNGNGMGDANDSEEDTDPVLDEDDHDAADIYVCDVATIIDTEDEGPHSYGDEIKYTVEVHNQGNGAVTNIQLQNLFGEGLKYLESVDNLNAGWVRQDDGELSLVIDEPIAPSDMVEICLTMEVLPVLMPDTDSWLQNVEIVKFEDPNAPGEAKHDVDSTPDDDPDNDSGGDPDDATDDVLDGDGSGNPADPDENSDPDLDEDDQDTENIEICDLALKNVISVLPTNPKVGDTIKYEVIVYNQGNYDVNAVSLNF